MNHFVSLDFEREYTKIISMEKLIRKIIFGAFLREWSIRRVIYCAWLLSKIFSNNLQDILDKIYSIVEY